MVASWTASPRSGVRSGAERIPVFWTSSTRPPSPTTVWYADSNVPLYCFSYSNISYDSVVPLAFERLSLIRSELALEASVVLSAKGLRELVQLVIRGECLTGYDSIADDRSFALVPKSLN